MKSGRRSLVEWIVEYVRIDAPQQYLHVTAIRAVRDLCHHLDLPAPNNVGGNAVIGDLSNARFVLSAHMDEASFNVISVEGNEVRLFACHRYVATEPPPALAIIGTRGGEVHRISVGEARCHDGCITVTNDGDIRLGDRAVYDYPPKVTGSYVAAKAIDDRVGAVVALHAMADLSAKEFPTAVVLSDGEQNVPEGYFSRTFPHVLSRMRSDATILFIDGMFQTSLEKAGYCSSPEEAFIVPHSGYGRGYTVPPLLFGELRDRIVPEARRQGIQVSVSSAYHGRGDDWGLVTNPTSGYERPAIFVSFGGWGRAPARRVVHTSSIENCRRMVVHTVESLACRATGVT